MARLAGHTYTQTEDKFILDHAGQFSFAELGRRLGLNKDQVRGRYKRLEPRVASESAKAVGSAEASPRADGQEPLGWSGNDASRCVTFVIELPELIHNPEELLAKAGIQYDQTAWEISSFKTGAWSTPVKTAVTKVAENRWQTEVGVVQNYKVQVNFRRRSPVDPAAIKADIIAEIHEATRRCVFPKLPRRAKPQVALPGHCLELCFFDLHYGKLCWAAETGENYDIKIADQRVEMAVNEIISSTAAFHFDQILLPIGNDLVNIDNATNTTAGGTPQDVDSRIKKILKQCRLMLLRQILKLAQIAPVVVPVVPGNHDSLSTWTIGDSLESYFADGRGKRIGVTVDNSPLARKFHLYGENLFMFTHGDNEKTGDLPGLMAIEAPKLWALAKRREIHMGHLHKQTERWFSSVDQKTGVKLRVMRSLSGTDAWHYEKGYVGQERAAEAIIWHPSRGQVAEFASIVPPDAYA